MTDDRRHGFYGPITGRRARTWGITHVAVRERTIVGDWIMSNEFELLLQLSAPG